METGHFENGGTVYVISTPKTPLPWKNQLFSAGYDMEVSQRLSGASYLTENYKRYPVFAADKVLLFSVHILMTITSSQCVSP